MCLPNRKVYKDLNDHCLLLGNRESLFISWKSNIFINKDKINEVLIHGVIDKASEHVTNIGVKQTHSGVTMEETLTYLQELWKGEIVITKNTKQFY